MQTKDPNIRIGLIGAGQWGQNHLRVLAQMGVLGGVADTNKERLEIIRAAHPNIFITESYAELLRSEKIDAVVIATPVPTHFVIATQALKSGKHTFVEKPLALRVEEGKLLEKEAKKANKLLMVGHLLHYHPAIIELKKIIDRGELGELKHIAAHRLNIGVIRSEENVIWSLTPHDISLILNFFGAVPERVQVASNSYVQKNIADTAHILLSFSNNRNATIYASWLNPFKERKLTFIGTKGMAVFDDLAAQKLVIYHTFGELDKNGLPKINNKGSRIVEIPNTEPLINELEHFIISIETDSAPITDGAEGTRVLSVLEQCR